MHKILGRKGLLTAMLVSGGVVGLTAAPASAAQHYDIVSSTGHAFSQLTTNNLFPSSVDDATIILSTTAKGAAHMPFAVKIYGSNKSSMQVSSNGNIQFFTNTTAFDNNCLPSTFGDPSGAAGKAIAVFWDDLYVDTSQGDGVFTKTTGTAPHRTFTVSWQARLYSNRSVAVRAAVVFFEGSTTIRMNYGTGGGGSATIGVQKSTTPPYNIATQWSCNSGNSTTVRAGLRLDYAFHA